MPQPWTTSDLIFTIHAKNLYGKIHFQIQRGYSKFAVFNLFKVIVKKWVNFNKKALVVEFALVLIFALTLNRLNSNFLSIRDFTTTILVLWKLPIIY